MQLKNSIGFLLAVVYPVPNDVWRVASVKWLCSFKGPVCGRAK